MGSFLAPEQSPCIIYVFLSFSSSISAIVTTVIKEAASQKKKMVTTRHTSYSPEAQDTASNTPASAHTAKRRAANMEQPSTSAASKKRKVGQSQPQKITIAAAPNQATRIRFGSEEPVIPIQVVKDTDAEDEEEENEDSDDEAPEDISASAAQLHTEEAEAAAARAIEQYVVMIGYEINICADTLLDNKR